MGNQISHTFVLTFRCCGLRTNGSLNVRWNRGVVEDEVNVQKMSKRTPPRKLNITDSVAGPAVNNSHHHSQGIAALFAITFDLRVFANSALKADRSRQDIQ